LDCCGFEGGGEEEEGFDRKVLSWIVVVLGVVVRKKRGVRNF